MRWEILPANCLYGNPNQAFIVLLHWSFSKYLSLAWKYQSCLSEWLLKIEVARRYFLCLPYGKYALPLKEVALSYLPEQNISLHIGDWKKKKVKDSFKVFVNCETTKTVVKIFWSILKSLYSLNFYRLDRKCCFKKHVEERIILS